MPARTARVPVRSGTVRRKGPERPGGAQPDFRVNVVDVREGDAPAGGEPLHWLLRTSRPCRRWRAGRRIAGR